MRRQRTVYLAIAVALMLALLPVQIALAVEVCGQWDMVEVMGGEYIIQNNVWGADTAQCISVPNTNSNAFTVSSSAHNQGSVASYPSVFKGCHWGTCTSNSGMPVLVNQISSAPFSWSVTRISSGTWNVAAEAWLSASTDSSGGYAGGGELMIWLDYQGMQPAGSQVGTANIGGVSYQVWYSQMDWNYVAYRPTSTRGSINADLKAFIDDAVSRGYMQNSWYLHDFEAGFELMVGGAGFSSNSFSFSVNGGGPQPTATTPPQQPTATPVPGGEPCSPATSRSLPFTQNGSGEYCWSVNAAPEYINSWNLATLEVNGVDFTNQWAGASSLPAPINGLYYIYYHSNYSWGHFEAAAGTSVPTPTSGPAATPTRTPTTPPQATPTRTPTTPAQATPTRTPTRTPTTPAQPTATPSDCLPDGARCTSNSECCSGVCGGSWWRRTCQPSTSPTPTTPAQATPTGTPTRTPTTPPQATPTRTPTRTPTSPPNATPTRTPTRTPTTPPQATPTRTPTPGSGGGTCSPATSRSLPFTQNGAGEYCWVVSQAPNYINSWNLATLEVNGVDFTNQWTGASSLPAAIGGQYYIYYDGNYSWSHFEAAAGTTVPTPTSGPGPTPTRTPTSAPGPTSTPGPTPTRTRTPTQGPTAVPGTHLANPFSGASWYVNPDWADSARASGGSAIANYNTAVWMDRIGAITDGRGLQGHLDEALSQGANLIMIVVYDLPNRDCAALASNGELLIAQDGLNRYKTEYIDPIVSIFSNSAYRNLRIVVVLEPDSLPNLVTNTDVSACAEAQSSGAYVQGIQYAINRLHTLSNVYIYLDIAHSGWLGWDSNFNPTVDLYTQTIQGTTDGLNSVDGFITNTANYTPVEEPYLPNADLQVNGQPVKSANFYEYNPYLDELDFAQALRSAFVNRGFPSGIGMLIDTSRNGWGGSARPTGVSSSTDLNTYVDQSRIDRRPHRGGWCNQQGAGIGYRPQASPASGLDAYVWVKPPGESDGVSEAGIVDPNDPNKQFDAMCDPNASNRYNSSYGTNAMPNAPHAGRWFEAQFQMLLSNAYPAVN